MILLILPLVLFLSCQETAATVNQQQIISWIFLGNNNWYAQTNPQINKSTTNTDGYFPILEEGTKTANARLYYTKPSNPDVNVSVNVYLKEGLSNEYGLQFEFNPISQECNCYYIEAGSLLKRFPSIPNSPNYRLLFQSDDGSISAESGFFGIKRRGATIPRQPTISVRELNLRRLSNNTDRVVGDDKNFGGSDSILKFSNFWRSSVILVVLTALSCTSL